MFRIVMGLLRFRAWGFCVGRSGRSKGRMRTGLALSAWSPGGGYCFRSGRGRPQKVCLRIVCCFSAALTRGAYSDCPGFSDLRKSTRSVPALTKQASDNPKHKPTAMKYGGSLRRCAWRSGRRSSRGRGASIVAVAAKSTTLRRAGVRVLRIAERYHTTMSV